MPDPIKRGEFYEDCRYFPMICVRPAAAGDDELLGISLMDGSVGACSETHCGVVRLTPEEAIERCDRWDTFAAERGLAHRRSRGAAPG